MKNLKAVLEFILERLSKHDAHNKEQDMHINEQGVSIKNLDLKLMQKLMQVDK
jgi:hypothetical protein